MVNFLKILHQTSRFGPRKAGYYKNALYKVVKTVTAAADYVRGTAPTYTEVKTEITGDLFPFVAKRWGTVPTDLNAQFVLSTNLKLNWENPDDSLCDEIEYCSVRYKIVDVRHYDRLGFDDHFDYALSRKSSQTGGV